MIRYVEYPGYARGKFHFAFKRIAPVEIDYRNRPAFRDEHNAFAAWCVEQFDAYGEWTTDFDGEFMLFKHEADAFAFKMRWC